MTVLVFANGDLEGGDWVKPFLDNASVVIAANGGSGHLWRLGYVPDVVIGDLDSLPQEVLEWVKVSNISVIQYPEEKDETDLELALLYAITQGQSIKVFAAAGGRLDQTLANIQLLAHPALSNKKIELVTAHERAWLVTAETEIRGGVGDTVSLIPLYGNVRIVETSGLQWSLKDELLTFGPARGVSNKMTAEVAEITVSSGKMLCIHTYKEWAKVKTV